ncbi:MAG TPA: (Fe-S)-binding protein, partial [Terriglobales bacterium]
VQSCYQFLCEKHEGGVGLILNCCGAPALWAGRKELFEKNCATLKLTWEQMGRPKIITACSSCFRTLKEHLPEVPIESLWPHLNTEEAAKRKPQFAGREYAIHDPCSTRGVSEVEDSVRGLLRRMGVEGKELNPRGHTTCCGYGGLARFANPDLTDKTLKRRAAESDADFVTYCAMCRDSFARQGKRALHVLDMVFDKQEGDPAARPDPGFSRRQDNRARLKSHLLAEVWGEKSEVRMTELPLEISEEVRQLMERRMILEEDVRKTINAAESSGQKFQLPNGHLLATHCPSCVTYWVEYTKGENAFEIHNAYSHRMQVR